MPNSAAKAALVVTPRLEVVPKAAKNRPALAGAVGGSCGPEIEQPAHQKMRGPPGGLIGIDQEVVTLRGPFGKLRVPATTRRALRSLFEQTKFEQN